MTQGTRRLIFVMLTIVLMISSCRGGETKNDPVVSTVAAESGGSVTSTLPATVVTSDTQEAMPLTPNPASIDITLEEGPAATATIGAEGGSIGLTDVNGTEYTLTIPEGALFSPEEITMTPIASAEGQAIGDTFLAGVSLQPEGLHFLELVTIEIAGGKIDESALAFAAESGGQDFHLTPSKHADGSVAISTTHFSDFGVSDEEIQDLLVFITPLADQARIEHDLTIGNDQQALDTLERIADNLQASGLIESFEQWNPWTAQIVSLFLRAGEVAVRRGWNANTPGFTDMTREMQNLIDQWFQKTDGIMQGFAEKCIQGEIEYAYKVQLIRGVGVWFVNRLNLERDEMMAKWAVVLKTCTNLVITWQANVTTTGENFFSDIAVGSEFQSSYFTDQGNPTKTELEIEFINGFWHDTCVPTSGNVKLGYEINWDSLNLGSDSPGNISSIKAKVEMVKPVYIDCSPAGFTLDADAQFPFHGGALDKLNQHRIGGSGFWEFELEYDPGGGVVAQFEQDPEKMTFPDGEYELWQLVSMYQNTPAN